jgi:integrase
MGNSPGEAGNTTLDDRQVERLVLPKDATQVIVWDTSLPRFGVVIGKKAKSFIVQNPTFGRRVIGIFPQMNTATARQRARLWLNQMDGGRDPREDKTNDRFIVEHPKLCNVAAPAVITVGYLVDKYMTHARNYYKLPNGKPTTEVGCLDAALSILREMNGGTLAELFGPLALAAVRQRMIDSTLSRRTINAYVDRIVRLFSWAVSQELIPPIVHHALTTLSALKIGRSAARDPEPVGPVTAAVVDSTICCLHPKVAAMVKVQLLTGARPSEICLMRKGEVDMSGEIWIYRPAIHKTSYRGKTRIINIGPKAQGILAPYLMRADDLVFGITRRAYWISVKVAAKAAGVEEWSPNRLRHSAGSSIAAKYGIEKASTVLGHSSTKTTEIYAERDQEAARRVASEMG